jgi:hypothetical protein
MTELGYTPDLNRQKRVEEGILNAIDRLGELDHYAVHALLSIADVQVTQDAANGTARIKAQGKKRLIQFDELFGDRPVDEIAAILLHELLHNAMGHLSRKRSGNPELWNVVEDAFINLTIHTIDSKLGEFFTNFYPPDDIPTLFLRSASRPPTVACARVYRQLYRGELSEEELYAYLDEFDLDWAAVPTIGEGSEPEGIGEEEMEMLMRELDGDMRGEAGFDQWAEKWEQWNRRRAGEWDPLNKAFEKSLAQARSQAITSELEEELRGEIRRQAWQPLEVQRPDMIQMMAGIDPLLWRSPRPSESLNSVALYVDVSRSTRKYLGWLYDCCMHFAELLDGEVHVFANDVRSVPLADLKNGVPTGQGTNFDPPFAHMLANRVQRALILTDGDGPLSEHIADEVRKSRLQVYVVFTPRHRPAVLGEVAQATWVLPAENASR